MNKTLLALLATVIFMLSSCATKEKVLYFQDITTSDAIPVLAQSPLRYIPGDKVSVVVSSSATPEIAQRFNLPLVTIQAGSATKGQSNQIAIYTIDEAGCIDIPVLGRTKIGGLTRSEAADAIQSALRAGHLLDAVVTVNSYDQYVTVLGEVKQPGRISINRDNMTLLEAIGQVGDLTIQARRDCIRVIRQEGEQTRTYFVDLRSKDLFTSPAYHLQQNDVVYVEPNKVRMGQSTNNDNSLRSISTWLSISSFLTTLSILIFNL